MLRERLEGALKDAIDSGDERAACDAAPDPGGAEGARPLRPRRGPAATASSDAEIAPCCATWWRSGASEIARCEACAPGRPGRAGGRGDRHHRAFLPPRMSEGEIARRGRRRRSSELGATRLKDTGRVIAALKERYNGQMDFATRQAAAVRAAALTRQPGGETWPTRASRSRSSRPGCRWPRSSAATSS